MLKKHEEREKFSGSPVQVSTSVAVEKEVKELTCVGGSGRRQDFKDNN